MQMYWNIEATYSKNERWHIFDAHTQVSMIYTDLL